MFRVSSASEYSLGESDNSKQHPNSVFEPITYQLTTNLKRQQCRLESESVSRVTKIGQVEWTTDDLVKAGGLLAVPTVDVHFETEQEMRRVFSLIYDVLRYKNILNQTLKDVTFFIQNPQLVECTPLVWLLLYDLYHRKFLKRDIYEHYQEKFAKAGLLDVDNTLWSYRVRIAASVSRLRIKNSALKLSQLLPPHLQDERVAKAAGLSPVTCWINTYLINNVFIIAEELSKNKFMQFDENKKTLSLNEYCLDTVCPFFLSFHPLQRVFISQCSLANKCHLIVQDRSFCLGPAAFHKLLIDYELCGNVVQTHINSPRATAYLGSLLRNNENLMNLYAFGAGERKEEFENYMISVGATNIRVFAERLIDISPEAEFLENVTAVFATPPNSYSAVTDPIDLVCSRGGDLSMLQVLTESDISEEGRKRVAAILEEQRLTLKYAMSRPQIQFVLYETHSVVDAENQHMVDRVISEMNRFAKERHAELQGRIVVPPYGVLNSIESMDVNNNDDDISQEQIINKLECLESLREGSEIVSEYKRFSIASQESQYETDLYDDIDVPNCDLFEKGSLPVLCKTSDSCSTLSQEGCYLALIKRKELTHLNDKYMINVAESRGLFGENNEEGTIKKSPSKISNKSAKKKNENRPPVHKLKRKTDSNKIEEEVMARLTAPTQASLYRRNDKNQTIISPNLNSTLPKACKRHNRPYTSPQESRRAQRWWTETTDHLINLHRKHKLTSASNGIGTNANNILKPIKYEIWSDKCLGHPALHLTRTRPSNKILFPMHISTVIMPKIAKIL